MHVGVSADLVVILLKGKKIPFTTTMKKLLTLILVCITLSSWAQKAEDLFNKDVRVTWLGVDYSHVKLIGDFAQFFHFGERSSWHIKHKYFPAWNDLVLNEREKYDVRGMLRRDEIFYEIGMIDEVNRNTSLDEIESYNNPHYTPEDISKFVSAYDTTGSSGIGVVFIAESLNKADNEAYFHFVAFNLSTKEILIQQRLRSEPGGFGIRNYWAGALHEAMKKVERNYYWNWREEFAKK